jgi:flagellar biogenesis protein FliO
MAPTSGPVGLPSIGKVIFAFLFIVALAVAAVFALRRYQPQWSKHLAGSNSIRVLERSSVGGVRIYLLQVDGRKILLTEHRNAISLLALEQAEARDSAISS